jgi:hypothetical protein
MHMYIGNRLVPVEDAVADDDDFLKGAKKLTTLHSTWCVGECAAAPGS